jgi:hypothetical protein
MHGHVHGVSAQQFNPYSAVALAKTSAAQQAAATRRKLLRAAAEMGEVSSDAVALLGQWGGNQRQGASGGGAQGEREEPSGPRTAWNGAMPAGSVHVEPIASGRAISFYV